MTNAAFVPRLARKNRSRIIYALMMKYALGKHGHHSLGFFWMLGEPMFLLSGVIVLWSLAHATHGSDVEVIPFALSTYAYLTLWRHIVSGSIRLIQASRSILFFRQVELIDVHVAKCALETVSLFSVFVILYIPLFLLHLCPALNDPLMLVGGFFFTSWFSFSFGLILASITALSEVATNFVGAIMYITLPVTGAFTMQEWLPDGMRYLLSWSPLVNCVEIVRGGLFGPEIIAVHYDISYLIVCCSVTTCIGLIIFSLAVRKGEIG